MEALPHPFLVVYEEKNNCDGQADCYGQLCLVADLPAVATSESAFGISYVIPCDDPMFHLTPPRVCVGRPHCPPTLINIPNWL